MLKIALTGSTGLVGSRIIELLGNSFEFIPILQEDVDITDRKGITRAIDTMSFDILLHLAAYTNVDGAETQAKLAHTINVEGTKNIYDAVTNKGKKLVYISTDYVFDGTNPPYDETSVPNPIGVYGTTKYGGEEVVKENAMIVRISYPYRSEFEIKKDFIRALKTRLEEGKPLSMVGDIAITPTFIDDIAYGLRHLFEHFSPEVFHLVGSSSHTPYEIALLVAETFNLDKSLISKTTFNEYFPHPETRPRDTRIISKKNNFYPMHNLEEGLQIIKKQM